MYKNYQSSFNYDVIQQINYILQADLHQYMVKKKINNCKVAQEHSANSAEFMILYKENNYCLISQSFRRRSYLKDTVVAIKTLFSIR